MRALLLRWADSPDGVFGTLDLFDDAGAHAARFWTAEDDWLNNTPKQSCIPSGAYLCRRGVFPRMGETFEVTGVAGRSAILFHAGNTEEDVEGCILVGEDRGAVTLADEDLPGHPVRAKWAVIKSKDALARFIELLTGVQTFPLEIRWAKLGEWRTI